MVCVNVTASVAVFIDFSNDSNNELVNRLNANVQQVNLQVIVITPADLIVNA